MVAHAFAYLAASLMLLEFTTAASSFVSGYIATNSAKRCTTTKTVNADVTVTSTEFIYTTETKSFYYNFTTTTAPTSTTVFPPADFTPIRSEIVAQGYTPSKRDLSKNLLQWLGRRGLNTTSSHAKTSATTKQSTKVASATLTGYKSATMAASSSAQMITAKGSTSTLRTIRKTSSQSAASSCAVATKTETTTTTTTSQFLFTEYAYTNILVTSTVQVAVATHYAACDDSNRLSRVEGCDINPDGSFPRGYDGISVLTPYDCCAAAIQGQYALSAYEFSYGLGQCRLFYNTQAGGICTFNGTQQDLYVYPNGGRFFTISNGYCGTWVYAGIEGEPSIIPPKPTQTS